MKLITIKKLEDGSWFLDGHKYVLSMLLAFLFFFLLISLLNWDVIVGFWISLGLILIITPIVIINDILGKKKHKSIHQSSLFSDLRLDGFEKESFGEYLGLIKIEKNRTIRIYYDWDKKAKGFLSFGDIVINIFYYPLIDFEKDKSIYEMKTKVKRIENLSKQYSSKKNSKTKYFFSFDRIIIHTNYYPWSKYNQIRSVINDVFGIINREHLKPFDTNILEPIFHEVEKDGGFLPQFELVYEEIMRNVKS